MIKFFSLPILFLMLVLFTSCGQKQKEVPKETIKTNNAGYSESQLNEADTSRVPTSMVRNVKQASNGDILIASYLGVFRYDASQAARAESSGDNEVWQGFFLPI